VNPAEQAHTFFDALLGGNGELLAGSFLTVSWLTAGKPEPRTRWTSATVDDLASAVTGILGDDVTGVYVGLGLTTDRPSPEVGRLRVEHATGVAFLSLDIDIAGAGHSDKPYAPTTDTALSLAHCLGLAPTVVIHTGHGIQAFYRLAEPWIFGATDVDDDGAPVIDAARVATERAAAVELVWAFVTSVRIRAKQIGGWHVDPTGDLARLVRVPGTRNRKVAGENLPVEIVECDPSRRYDREDIEAVLAPRSLLDTYRSAREAGGDLEGVDLAGLWAQVKSSPNFMPPWLASVIESGWDEPLCRIWSGEDDKRYGNNDSDIDMALVAAVLRLDLGVEAAAQIVMSRRLRIDRKVDKADPAGRAADYLGLTIGKVAARIRARESVAESNASVIDAVLAEVDEPPTQVVAPDAGSNDNVVSLQVGPDPEPEPTPVTPLRRPEPTPEPDPEVEHADAPRVVKPGMGPSIPSGPTPKERTIGDQLAAHLGLPEGVAIWAAGIRRLPKNSEIRLWLYRNSSSLVHGGKWKPNTVAATRWHTQSDWEARATVKALVMRDLHLVIDPSPQRAWAEQGLLKLYELARPMDEGTPAEQVRMSVLSQLRQAEGTGLFSTAVLNRCPWLDKDEHVWLALDALRQAITAAGYGVFKPMLLADTLDELGCKVQAGMKVDEGHRVVDDELPWVLLGDELFTPLLAEHVKLRAVNRDAADARAGLRMIGPS